MLVSISLECNGCGICEVVCPTDVIRMDESSGMPIIQYAEDCMTCYNCKTECPKDCIQVEPFRKPMPEVIDTSHLGVNKHE